MGGRSSRSKVTMSSLIIPSNSSPLLEAALTWGEEKL